MAKKVYERPMIRSLDVSTNSKYGARTEFLPLKEIEGHMVKKLLSEYGSPLFVLSESKIKDNFEEAKRAFDVRYPKVQFAWSYKTNYLNAVCNIFHQEGSWAEVVSSFEYQKAIKNGVPGDKIIFNGPEKSEEELRLAIQNRSLIHIDHFDELYKLHEIAPSCLHKPRVAIRVNMDTGVYPKWDRFGFNYENGQAWDALEKIVAANLLSLEGVHTHIGTFMLSPQAFSIATGKMIELTKRLKSNLGKRISYIDMGGGFASKNTLKGSYLQGDDSVPEIEEYAEAICTPLLAAGFSMDEMPTLILECGRVLVDDAGYLLGTVLANKRLSDSRRATIVDFGLNIMFTSMWYNHKISPAQDFGKHVEDTTLFGPLCMNIDVVRNQITLPPMNPGDHLVVHHMGAYNITQSMQFISLRPAIVLLSPDGGKHVVRRKERLEDLEIGETLPEHLKKINL